MPNIKPIQSVTTEHDFKVVWTNPIIQIGYDFILATGSKRQKLSQDLNEWLKKSNATNQREAILQKIRDDFDIVDAEKDA